METEPWPVLQLAHRLKLRAWPDPCFFYDRAALLQVFVADVYRDLLDGVRPGDAVIDCGANVGCFSIAASRRVGPRGSVIAIEPEPGNLAALRANLGALGIENVVVVPKALSNEPGRTLEISGSGMFAHVSQGGTRVGTTSLAEVVNGVGDRPLAAIKMDIEGSELVALRGPGAREALGRTRAFEVEIQGDAEERAVRQVLVAAGLSRVWVVKEYELLPQAALRVLRHPSLLFRLYGEHMGEFVDRLLKGFTGTLRPDPASEQGFVSRLVVARRP